MSAGNVTPEMRERLIGKLSSILAVSGGQCLTVYQADAVLSFAASEVALAVSAESKAHESTKRDLDTALGALVELRELCGRVAETLHPWKIHLESAAGGREPLRVHGETRFERKAGT